MISSVAKKGCSVVYCVREDMYFYFSLLVNDGRMQSSVDAIALRYVMLRSLCSQ